MDAMDDESFGIGELVDRTGVPATSIHHYRRIGLLPPPRRESANRFLYDTRHERAVRLVRLLRDRRRMPLSEIATIVPACLDDDELPPDLAELLVESDGADERVAHDLVEEAAEAFSARSFGEVTIGELCDRVGIGKGTFYRHFPSKEALFLRAVEMVVERSIEDFAVHVADAGGEPDMGASAEVFADMLRPGLPLLLELAKRSVQAGAGYEGEARRVFRGLADRLGRTLQDDDQAYLVGGSLILDAVVHVFYGLVGGADES